MSIAIEPTTTIAERLRREQAERARIQDEIASADALILAERRTVSDLVLDARVSGKSNSKDVDRHRATIAKLENDVRQKAITLEETDEIIARIQERFAESRQREIVEAEAVLMPKLVEAAVRRANVVRDLFVAEAAVAQITEQLEAIAPQGYVELPGFRSFVDALALQREDPFGFKQAGLRVTTYANRGTAIEKIS